MFEKLFGRGSTPKSANSVGLGASPEHVQQAFSPPNKSGTGFDKGPWGPSDVAKNAPSTAKESSSRAVLDQPATGYVAAEEAKPDAGNWSDTSKQDPVEIPGSPADAQSGNQDDEQMAAK